MREIVKTIREQIKTLVAEQVASRKEARALLWMPETEEKIALLSSVRGPDGHRVNGKRALKAYRRPETAGERCAIHSQRMERRVTIRVLSLASAFLRGMKYRQVEPKTEGGTIPSLEYHVHYFLTRKFPEGQCPFTRKDIAAWVKEQG